MKQMFIDKQFESHSAVDLLWKIECNSLTDQDLKCLANLVARKFVFSSAVPVQTGGLQFADLLNHYADTELGKWLVVDDVLTTGKSMNQERQRLMKKWHVEKEDIIGVVIFARKKPDNWIYPIFQLSNAFHD